MAEIRVCRDAELPEGQAVTVEAGTIEVGVIRHDGKLYAYENLCPHQGGPVCEGIRMPRVLDVVAPDRTLEGQQYDFSEIHIVCPWHGYEYRLEDGVNANDPKLRLRKFPVLVRDGEIYVVA